MNLFLAALFGLVAITNIEICFHSIALLLRSDLHVQVNQ
jgi:hypothetical protein